MAEHASVFYSQDMQCYLLCYDSDLEKLPGASRLRLPKGFKLAPYRMKPYNSGSINKAYALRMLYKPENTTRGKSPDGTVDMYCVVSHDWIQRMAMQYELVFPAGLPQESLIHLTECEVLDV